MEELKKGSLESDERARSHFQQAINLDPAFSLAYSGMSLTYFNEWSCQLWDRWEVSQKGAYEWARKAIYLDEQNYVACLVLGRVYLYEAEYKLAEHYLRRALRLNPNDLDNLIHTASCFVYLGYQEEAEELYQKVLQLHPLNSKTYHYIGSFIAFERGRFEECIALGAGSSSPWIDTPAVLAAAYYALGDLVNMEKYWAMFLKRFQEKIAKGESVAPETAAQWFIDVSPYKHTSRMRPFLEYIGKKQIFAPRQFYRTATDSAQHYFLKEGELWVLMFDGKSIRMPEVKGLYDLAKLIQYPEKPVHCTELMGGGVVSKPVPVLDEKAKRVYRKKILELQEEIQYSERNNDLLRTTQLQQEYDHVVSHLATSLGLHGRTRKVSGELEKVRSAVTWRIRHAIQKIKKNHPALGKHLSMSIKTGILCRYAPEKPMAWIVEDK
jgi:tetratricopeptide (TPR) repeat protein